MARLVFARLILACVACAACGGAPAGPEAPAAPRPLTPADVGLPDVPPEEPRAPPREVPARPEPPPGAPPEPPGYYRREACPPYAGCLLTREITDDAVRTSYSCSYSSGGTRWYRALRSVRIVDLQVEGGLDRAAVRRVFIRKIDDWKRCLARAGTADQIQIRGAIAASGAPVTADVTAADEPGAACLRDVTAASSFQGASEPTLYTLTLDYDVTSPATVPPLQCR
ncbi:MAG TPA: hypothetical protein VNO30_30430 [Kofleriaceae bacterium]|nr:hypothetical protein [Kofleriaceae bacterium]